MTTLVGRFKDRTRRRLWAQRLHRSVRDSEQLKLIIGAGRTDFDGWIATEQQLVDLLKPSMWVEFFEVDSVHAILAEHVWEHLTPQQGLVATRTCFQFLKSGGYLRVTVPDGHHPWTDYIERVRPGGSGEGADDHSEPYTYKVFSAIFAKAGFDVCLFDVCLVEYFDEDGQFHANPWDETKGMIRRSLRFDERNRTKDDGYTSLFLDAVNPIASDTSKAA